MPILAYFGWSVKRCPRESCRSDPDVPPDIRTRRFNGAADPPIHRACGASRRPGAGKGRDRRAPGRRSGSSRSSSFDCPHNGYGEFSRRTAGTVLCSAHERARPSRNAVTFSGNRARGSADRRLSYSSSVPRIAAKSRSHSSPVAYGGPQVPIWEARTPPLPQCENQDESNAPRTAFAQRRI